MHRAEGAARALHEGQAPEVVEAEGRKAGLSLVSAVIGDQLGRNDPEGLALFRQYRDQLDPRERHVLGAAAEMLTNTIAAADWLRDRSASLAAAPTLTGDAALDAVNVATGSVAEPPPVTSWSGRLLQQDGVLGHRERMTGIEDRRRALTALNEHEFAGDPVRRRANQTAINTDAARNRAAAKAEADKAYADLQRHLTTGGPGGGPAVTLPPATLLSRFTAEQLDAVADQVNRAIEGKKTRTDPPTWYAINQGLTSDDADERQRWADTNLVQFRGELSDEDLAASTRLQTMMRTNDGSAEATRQQAITRMANRALLAAGIDPTPTQDRAPEGHTTQAATFRRALDDELSTFESSEGRPATTADAQDIVSRLATSAANGGWPKIRDPKVLGNHVELRRLPSPISEKATDNDRNKTDSASSADTSPGRWIREKDEQWTDPFIVPVAGGDKKKDTELRPRQGPGARNHFYDEFPSPRQISPPGMPGGFGVPRMPRPSPSSGETPPKPSSPANPSSSGTGKSPAGGGDTPSKKEPAGGQDFIEVNNKRLPRPVPTPANERQPVRLSSLDEGRKIGMASANYSQSNYREAYSEDGRLKDWMIDDVAEALRTKKLSPKDVVVDFVLRKGQWLMHNTRSPQALLRAGIPKEEWYVRDMTNDKRTKFAVEKQLRRNNLQDMNGTPTVVSQDKEKDKQK